MRPILLKNIKNSHRKGSILQIDSKLSDLLLVHSYVISLKILFFIVPSSTLTYVRTPLGETGYTGANNIIIGFNYKK